MVSNLVTIRDDKTGLAARPTGKKCRTGSPFQSANSRPAQVSSGAGWAGLQTRKPKKNLTLAVWSTCFVFLHFSFWRRKLQGSLEL